MLCDRTKQFEYIGLEVITLCQMCVRKENQRKNDSTRNVIVAAAAAAAVAAAAAAAAAVNDALSSTASLRCCDARLWNGAGRTSRTPNWRAQGRRHGQRYATNCRPTRHGGMQIEIDQGWRQGGESSKVQNGHRRISSGVVSYGALGHTSTSNIFSARFGAAQQLF